MFRLIHNITAEAYRIAKERGKDVSCYGCLMASSIEMNEYWEAKDAERDTKENDVDAAELINEDELTAYYEDNLHNTTYDELADVIITAATWLQAAKIASEDAEEEFRPERSTDVMLASGALAFTIDRIQGITAFDTMINARLLQRMVNLKMSYNAKRKD